MGNVVSQISNAFNNVNCVNWCCTGTSQRQCHYVLHKIENTPILPGAHSIKETSSASQQTNALDEKPCPPSIAGKAEDRLESNNSAFLPRAALAVKGLSPESFEEDFSHRSLACFFALAGKNGQVFKLKYEQSKHKDALILVRHFAQIHFVLQRYLKSHPEKNIITAPAYFIIQNKLGKILARDTYDLKSHFILSDQKNRQIKVEALAKEIFECCKRISTSLSWLGDEMITQDVMRFIFNYFQAIHCILEMDSPCVPQASTEHHFIEHLHNKRCASLQIPEGSSNREIICKLGEDINIICQSVKLFITEINAFE